MAPSPRRFPPLPSCSFIRMGTNVTNDMKAPGSMANAADTIEFAGTVGAVICCSSFGHPLSLSKFHSAYPPLR